MLLAFLKVFGRDSICFSVPARYVSISFLPVKFDDFFREIVYQFICKLIKIDFY